MGNSLFFRGNREVASDIVRPHLDLCADSLRRNFASLVQGAEEHGGVERYVEALKLRGALFQDVLGSDEIARDKFAALCGFMPTVRRRAAPYLGGAGFERVRAAMAELTAGMSDTATADKRVAAFCAAFPDGRAHRFVRDLACEVLHGLDHARYPLMLRWVWDAKANTGVLREIWFAENIDHITIPVADDYATFLMLREELAQFISDTGVFRDVAYYVDLLCAQIYAGYIAAQGGSYLRTDFAAPEDPTQHLVRMLGLDGVKAGRTRTNSLDALAPG